MKKIEEPDVRILVEAGAIRGATAIADGRAWYVVLDVGAGERVLGSQRRHRREFKDLDKLVSRMRSLGIGSLRVDATHYNAQEVA